MSIQSTVQKKGGETKGGKGFSRDELREAGLDPKKARRLGISIDLRRKTRHKENVKTLKQHVRSLTKKRKRQPRTVKKS